MTKQQQLDIILSCNPANEDFADHTWIRSIEDIFTFEEAIENEGGDIAPDFTNADAKDALQKGEIIVYSSYPIELGTFVTPSRMIAQDYAGGRKAKVYSKLVHLDDVAWISCDEGQYTGVGNTNNIIMKTLRRIQFVEPDPNDPYWISYCESDPDLVKADGYMVPFQADGGGISNDVVIMVEDDLKIRDLLRRWVYGEGYSGSMVQSWKVFDQADNAVAFRGGSGYVYTITVFDGQ